MYCQIYMVRITVLCSKMIIKMTVSKSSVRLQYQKKQHTGFQKKNQMCEKCHIELKFYTKTFLLYERIKFEKHHPSGFKKLHAYFYTLRLTRIKAEIKLFYTTQFNPTLYRYASGLYSF